MQTYVLGQITIISQLEEAEGIVWTLINVMDPVNKTNGLPILMKYHWVQHKICTFARKFCLLLEIFFCAKDVLKKLY